jgi:cation diffusion facilitator family transporter
MPAEPPQVNDAQSKLAQSAAEGSRTVVWGILASVGLATLKVIAGIAGNSYALLADGVESMLDVISSLVVWGSLKIAARTPDERFPYGYGKAEPLAALVIATALLATAAGISIQSAREIRLPHHAPAPFTLVVLVGVVVTKEIMFRVLSRTGARIGSHAMKTDAWHHRSDSLTSLAAFIGISVALVAGPGYESADDWAALFASAVIAWNGVRLFLSAWGEIMDVSPPPELTDEIRRIAGGVDGVTEIDLCRVRKSGLGLWVDIHVVVDGDISVRAGHTIAHRVKDALVDSRHHVMDAVVHIEPAGGVA